METTIMQVFRSGLTPALAMTLLQMLIVLFAVRGIRSWMGNLIARRLAYRTLRNHRYLTEGCWVRLPTSPGHVDARVVAIAPHRVVLRTKEAFGHVPIREFASGRKSILKIQPPGEDPTS